MLKVEVDGEKDIFRCNACGNIRILVCDVLMLIHQLYGTLNDKEAKAFFRDRLKMAINSEMVFAQNLEDAGDKFVEYIKKRMGD